MAGSELQEAIPMKRWLMAGLLTIALCGPAIAQEPTLVTGSMDAYQASLVAMSEPLGPDRARDLILKLLILAGGPVPAGVDPAVFRQNVMAKVMADPQVFLDGIKQYEGLTAAQIMAIKTGP
jgi:hypothetical protein